MMDFRKGKASLRPGTPQETQGFGKQKMAEIIKEQNNPEVKKVTKRRKKCEKWEVSSSDKAEKPVEEGQLITRAGTKLAYLG